MTIRTIYGSIEDGTPHVKQLDDDDGDGVNILTTSCRLSRWMLAVAAIVLSVVGILGRNRVVKTFESPLHHQVDQQVNTTNGRSYGNTPRFFLHQKLDHYDLHDDDDDDDDKKTWTQRYYAERKYFRGPGHPIFLEIGGEGGLDMGMFSPFVEQVLADKFGAYVLHPEHRFYGISLPIVNATVDELVQYLTPGQALRDMLAIAQYYQDKLGCSDDKSSDLYCPIMTIGGSYPGFLSAMARMHYPDIVDIGYASSAPLLLYANQADPNSYYEAITDAAEHRAPGCPRAVKKALTEVNDMLQNMPDFIDFAHRELNVCPGTIPDYIQTSELLSQELLMTISTSFADANMIGNYPPSNSSWFAKLCHNFQDEKLNSVQQVANFWSLLEIKDNSTSCFVMDLQLSEGRHPTLSGADWSGLGPGLDGTMWDFQCCATLLPKMSFSKASMFVPRKWTYEWVKEHCLTRFGVVGGPNDLVTAWQFSDIVEFGGSRIIFTNGGQDMWKPGSYQESLSDSLVVIDMPSGGHHSELYAMGVNLTADVERGQHQVADLLQEWFNDI